MTYPNPPIIFTRDYTIVARLVVNIGRVEDDGNLADDPATWTATDLAYALEVGHACYSDPVKVMTSRRSIVERLFGEGGP